MNKIDIEPEIVPVSYNGNTVYYTAKIVDIGHWDMLNLLSKDIAHGLSATEYKTIKGVTIIVRDDANILYYDIQAQYAGRTMEINATNIVVERIVGRIFNTADFSTISYNRGYAMFYYITD
jgi:hypothetical protein